MRFVDKIKYAAVALLAAGGTLALSALATMNSSKVYEQIKKPFFAPSGKVFPIVWGILFLLMAVSSYIVLKGGAPNRKKALLTYFAHLPVNFLWGVIFFDMQNFMLAGLLQIPYAVWVAFAAVLNAAVWLLNR